MNRALINANPRGRKPSTKAFVAHMEGELKDFREESFVRMVCDGMTLGEAYKRAGFNGKSVEAAHKLFALERIKVRAEEVMFARATTAAVSLEQVTDMLSRVFVGAVHKEEYSAAHNAAFSLARLYGHVTERSQVEVLRKPSREPDAPAELSLTAWISGMIPGPGAQIASGGPLSRAPAALLGEPSNHGDHGKGPSPAIPEGPSPQLDLFNDLNSLAAPRDGREIENTSWQDRLTGTPITGARTAPVGVRASQKDGSPLQNEGTGYPKWEDLF